MSKFQKIEFYKAKSNAYTLLPFRFTPLDETRYVVTNMAGEYLVTDRDKVERLVRHELPHDDPAYIDFRSRHFLVDESTSVAPDLLAIKVRTKHERLADFTALHMFVVTLRCEHSCPYCQVSRQSEDKALYDMTPAMASKALDLVFRSPSKHIKIEFQGGEPLLNFDLIRFIVLEAEQRNATAKRNLAFVIATNLALVTDEILNFCSDHGVLISTSLDGPKDLHNANRPRPGKNSYAKAVEGINRVRERLGRHQVSALMTTTERSLDRVTDIVDEYVARSFNGIFLRPLSPYGFAIKTKSYRAYNAERWMEFYKRGLDYIIDLNRQDIPFTEYYASTVLKKMLTCDDPGYVDLMSPAGIGIAACCCALKIDPFWKVVCVKH